MKSLGQLLSGILAALGSALFVLAALALSVTEGLSVAVVNPAISPSPTVTQPTLPAGVTPTITTQAPATITLTATVTCRPPAGWDAYTVQQGDLAAALAEEAGISLDQLLAANCLISPSLLPGTILYLPLPASTQPTPTVTFTIPPLPTTIPCGAPPGWVQYTVQRNDNLFRLSQAFGVSVSQLRTANCLTGNLIQAGMRLYVPNVPTRTPIATNTVEPSPTDTATATNTSVPPTPTNTSEPEIPTETPTPTLAPTTEVPTPTASPTLETTATSTVTATATVATPTITNTLPVEETTLTPATDTQAETATELPHTPTE